MPAYSDNERNPILEMLQTPTTENVEKHKQDEQKQGKKQMMIAYNEYKEPIRTPTQFWPLLSLDDKTEIQELP